MRMEGVRVKRWKLVNSADGEGEGGSMVGEEEDGEIYGGENVRSDEEKYEDGSEYMEI
jgi:hypothetical protein